MLGVAEMLTPVALSRGENVVASGGVLSEVDVAEMSRLSMRLLPAEDVAPVTV
jgi:hypothetical protein